MLNSRFDSEEAEAEFESIHDQLRNLSTTMRPIGNLSNLVVCAKVRYGRPMFIYEANDSFRSFLSKTQDGRDYWEKVLSSTSYRLIITDLYFLLVTRLKQYIHDH